MEQHILEKLKERVETVKKVIGFAEEIKKELKAPKPKVEKSVTKKEKV